MTKKEIRQKIRFEFEKQIMEKYDSSSLELEDGGRWWFSINDIEFQVSISNLDVCGVFYKNDPQYIEKMELEQDLNKLLKEISLHIPHKVSDLNIKPLTKINLYINRAEDGSGSSMGNGVEGKKEYLTEVLYCGPIYNGEIASCQFMDGNPVGMFISVKDIKIANKNI